MNRTAVPHRPRGNFTRRATQWRHCEPCSAVAAASRRLAVRSKHQTGLLLRRETSLFVKPQSRKERCLTNRMINMNSDRLYVAEINNDLGRPGGDCYVH